MRNASATALIACILAIGGGYGLIELVLPESSYPTVTQSLESMLKTANETVASMDANIRNMAVDIQDFPEGRPFVEASCDLRDYVLVEREGILRKLNRQDSRTRTDVDAICAPFEQSQA